MKARSGVRKRGIPTRQSGIQSSKDRSEALDVILRAFTGPGRMERHMDQSLWRGDIYDPEHTRITVADGRVVSAVAMAPRMIQFGPVKIPAMTVGPVGTHDHYLKRGYSSAAMNDASKYMKENGYLVAYLGGIADYYYRFGYYPFLARTSVKFDREQARKESRPSRLRRMTRADLAAVRRLYDRATAGRICAAARDGKLWNWLLGPGRHTWLFAGAKVILDERGRLCGYLTMDATGELGFREIVVKPDETALRAALGALVREARKREAKKITLRLPWDDPLAVFLRQYVGGEFTMESHATGGALLKVVDFPALMQALEPLFQDRWAAAGPSLPPTRFTMKSELGAVGVGIDAGRVKIGPPVRGGRVRVGQRWLSGLLTGYHTVRDIAPRKQVSIPSGLLVPMEILFPSGWPFVYQADNY